MDCSHCGNNNDADAQFCNHCGNPLIDKQQAEQSGVKQNDFVFPTSNIQNNSGQGKLAALPPQLYGWNWGAFF
ncbi:MAG: zinc ribbon domain-containing protein [Ignavibacteriaceae bacterium]|jgi:hypothetical protein